MNTEQNTEFGIQNSEKRLPKSEYVMTGVQAPSPANERSEKGFTTETRSSALNVELQTSDLKLGT